MHLNGSIGRGSTGVDLNAIPVSAIERIEVLRDGAAAQYGSDAIAGVINIVLKGGVVAARRDVEVRPVEGIVRRQPLHAERAELHARGATSTSRTAGCSTSAARGGSPLGKGSVTVAAEYRHHNRTNRASFDPRDQIVAGDAGNNAVVAAESPLGRSRHARRDDVRQRQRAAEQRGDALPLRVRRLQPPRGQQRRLLPPRARRAQLAADLSARLPAGDRADRRRRVGHGRRPRRRQQVDLRRERRVRPQQLRLHDRRHAERVARPERAAEQDASSTPARSC